MQIKTKSKRVKNRKLEKKKTWKRVRRMPELMLEKLKLMLRREMRKLKLIKKWSSRKLKCRRSTYAILMIRLKSKVSSFQSNNIKVIIPYYFRNAYEPIFTLLYIWWDNASKNANDVAAPWTSFCRFQRVIQCRSSTLRNAKSWHFRKVNCKFKTIRHPNESN